MGSRKKKKQSSSIDNGQLAKGVFVVGLIAGGVYLFNQLGGGTDSAPSVVSLAPVHHAQQNQGGAARPQVGDQGHQQQAARPFAQPFGERAPESSDKKEMTPDEANGTSPNEKPEMAPFAGSNGFKVPPKTVEPNKDTESPQAIVLGSSREHPNDMIGTDHGNSLLADVNELSMNLQLPPGFDAAGELKQSIQKHAEQIMTKAEVNLSEEQSDSIATQLIVTLQTTPQKVGEKDALKVSLKAVLTGIDPDEKSENKFVKLWEINETEIGVVSSKAVDQGQIPKRLGEKLTSFFNKFRSAKSRAARSLN